VRTAAKKTPVKLGTRSTAVAARSRKSTAPRQHSPTAERFTEIQQALAAKGFYKGEPNGVWGPESVDALKRFQADQKLLVDGKIGSRSLIALGLGPKHDPTPDLSIPPSPTPQSQEE